MENLSLYVGWIGFIIAFGWMFASWFRKNRYLDIISVVVFDILVFLAFVIKSASNSGIDENIFDIMFIVHFKELLIFMIISILSGYLLRKIILKYCLKLKFKEESNENLFIAILIVINFSGIGILNNIASNKKQLFTRERIETTQFETSKLKEKTNLNDYLRYLRSTNSKDIIIVVAAKDEASRQYPKYKTNLHYLGTKLDFTKKGRWSYLAILDADSNNYIEEMSQKRLDKELKLNDTVFTLSSAGYTEGNVAIIKINGIDYSKNRRGLNIVVLNKNTGEILDSCYADAYGDNELKIKR